MEQMLDHDKRMEQAAFRGVSRPEPTEEISIDIIPKVDFLFRSKYVNDLISIINKHTTANERQISVKVLQNTAYLFSYGGMVNLGLPFYGVDLSPTGTGKTEIIKKSRQLQLSPVFERQQEAHHDDLDRYQEETLSAKGKEKDFVVQPKLHKCIHVTDTSPEALFESFEAQKAQMVEMGELGRKLKNQKYQDLINYIVEGHGASELPSPNYKNQRMSRILKIEHPQLYFYGDSNLRYLSRALFFEHLEGGLLNRCFLVYNHKVPKFDEMPEHYTIEKSVVNSFNAISREIISFAEIHKDKHITIGDKGYRKECERYFYDKRMTLVDADSPFANLYVRAIQNFRAITTLLHLIQSFESNAFDNVVSNETIKEAFEFCKWQFESYPLLMDEVGGIMDEVRTDDRDAKILQYVGEQKLPIPFRTVQRKFNIKKDAVIKAVASWYKIDKYNILYRV